MKSKTEHIGTKLTLDFTSEEYKYFKAAVKHLYTYNVPQDQGGWYYGDDWSKVVDFVVKLNAAVNGPRGD